MMIPFIFMIMLYILAYKVLKKLLQFLDLKIIESERNLDKFL